MQQVITVFFDLLDLEDCLWSFDETPPELPAYPDPLAEPSSGRLPEAKF